jgi:hypothetical protein
LIDYALCHNDTWRSDLGTSLEASGQLHARYPLYRRPGGPQSRSGRCEEEENHVRETSYVTAMEEQEAEGAVSKARGEYVELRKVK